MIKNSDANWSAGLEALCLAQQTKTPSAAIRGICSHLLKACNIESYPVSLKPLLDLLGVNFTWSNSGNNWKPGHGTASLKTVNGKLTILIHENNAQSNWRRSRFSIAHELIHAVLIRMIEDPKLIATLDSTEKDLYDLETICNIGAAEILMPSNMIRVALNKRGVSPEGLLQLYDDFLVSRESLIWRIVTVTPYSCVSRWRKYARNPREENRFRVISCYPPYEKTGTRPWLPEGVTTKHINSEMIEQVNTSREYIFENNLELKLNDRVWECMGIATYFQERAAYLKQPYFENFRVPDEIGAKQSQDILLFAAQKNKVDIQRLWGVMK